MEIPHKDQYPITDSRTYKLFKSKEFDYDYERLSNDLYKVIDFQQNEINRLKEENSVMTEAFTVLVKTILKLPRKEMVWELQQVIKEGIYKDNQQ